MSFNDLKNELCCSICLNTYIEPVTLQCGHSFCAPCIGQVLDRQELSGAYFCPMCRERFKIRPVPHKNTTLCNVVKYLESVSPEQSVDGILCTYCIGTQVPAAKSCLLCEASLCTSHLRVHTQSPEHVLVAPTIFPQNRKCTIHSEVLHYFSPEDVTCVYCMAQKSRQASRPARPSENQGVKKILEKLNLEREAIVENIQSLLIDRQVARRTADSYTRNIRLFFRKLRNNLSDLEKRLLNETTRQEEQVYVSLDELMSRLEGKKNHLSKQIGCIKEICSKTGSFPVPDSDTDDLGDEEETDREYQMPEERLHVDQFIPILISETLKRGLHDIFSNIKTLYPGTEAVDLTLDANTAGQDILVSRDMKSASWSRVKQKPKKNPERFQIFNQVLSAEIFTPGIYYWEIETCGSKIWRMGVAYPSLHRRDLTSRIGDNRKSWCLCRFREEYSVRHDKKKTTLSSKVMSSRLAVYLDSLAGTLSFYELGDPIQQLYTFTATFSEPLYAAFYLGGKGKLQIWEAP
ncbi:hypothetical protein GDO81_025044 [Engystomops pustulosus]|uniref:Uncharacterized protein n=1 Tax=Engystomops pustulosus TaxID=76066 RepID=A0AAV6ZQK7_ENGPU|nr:hypothetical protein GDO81_025044 [Engystomops pustulosus]